MQEWSDRLWLRGHSRQRLLQSSVSEKETGCITRNNGYADGMPDF